MSDTVIYNLIIIVILAILNSFMDGLNFYRKYDLGYFSVHTKDQKDAWHHSEKLMWLLIAVGFFWDQYLIIILAGFLIWIFHEVFLHYIWKKIFRS